MKNLLSFALLACVAISAPEVQGNALTATDQVMVADTAAEQNAIAQSSSFVLTAADMEFAVLNVLGTPLALGCCDQSYEVQRTMSATSCCDQSYSVHQASAIPMPLLAVVFVSFLLLMYTFTNHFKRTTAPWTLEH
jgi:hypothetical protein